MRGRSEGESEGGRLETRSVTVGKACDEYFVLGE